MKKAEYYVLCEVNTTRKCFVALLNVSGIRAFWFIARDRTRFARHFAATLAATITVLPLRSWHQPQTAA